MIFLGKYRVFTWVWNLLVNTLYAFCAQLKQGIDHIFIYLCNTLFNKTYFGLLYIFYVYGSQGICVTNVLCWYIYVLMIPISCTLCTVIHISKIYLRLKWGSVNFDVGKNVVHVLVWLFSNLSRQKCPTADILGIYFVGTIFPIKYMAIIFALLFWCHMS